MVLENSVTCVVQLCSFGVVSLFLRTNGMYLWFHYILTYLLHSLPPGLHVDNAWMTLLHCDNEDRIWSLGCRRCRGVDVKAGCYKVLEDRYTVALSFFLGGNRVLRKAHVSIFVIAVLQVAVLLRYQILCSLTSACLTIVSFFISKRLVSLLYRNVPWKHRPIYQQFRVSQAACCCFILLQFPYRSEWRLTRNFV
jgi:hypothetical protein